MGTGVAGVRGSGGWVGVFISYRRGDYSGMITGIVTEMLRRHLGDDEVFRDVISIPKGERYPDVLRQSLRSASAVVAVVDPDWFRTDGGTGERALDRPNDWVRWEIRTALESGKPIYPVLLDGSPEPSFDELPDDIRGFAGIQARRLRAESFDADVMALARDLEAHFEPRPASVDEPRLSHRRPGKPTVVSVAVALLAPWALLFAGTDEPVDLLILGMALGYLFVVFVGSVLVARLLILPIRGWGIRMDRQVHRMPARLLHESISRPFVLVLVAGYFLLVVADGLTLLTALIALVGGVAMVFYAGFQAARDVKEEAQWPPAVRRAGRSLVSTARYAVAVFHEHSAGWPRPLSLRHRQEATDLFAALTSATAELRADAELSRWRRQAGKRPRLTSTALIWAAAVEGLLLPAVPEILSGRLTPAPYIALAPWYAVPLMAALSLGAVEVIHRSERWEHRTVVAEIDDELEVIRNELRLDGR